MGCDPALAQFVERARYPQDIKGRRLTVAFSKEAEAEFTEIFEVGSFDLGIVRSSLLPHSPSLHGRPHSTFPPSDRSLGLV